MPQDKPDAEGMENPMIITIPNTRIINSLVFIFLSRNDQGLPEGVCTPPTIPTPAQPTP